MTESIICPNCQKPNRKDAKFCQGCGAALGPVAPASPPPPAGAPQAISDIIDKGAGLLKRITIRMANGLDKFQPFTELENSARPSPQGRANPPRAAVMKTAGKPGDRVGNYLIVEAWRFTFSNYYKVRTLACPQGHPNPDPLLPRCKECGTEFKFSLLRESLSRGPLSEEEVHRAIDLSRSVSEGLIRTIVIFEEGHHRFVACDYPGEGWQPLTQFAGAKADPQSLHEWGLALGQTLQRLCESGAFPRFEREPQDFFESILVAPGSLPAFADLTLFRTCQEFTAAQPGGQGDPQPQLVYFLAQILLFLANGTTKLNRDLSGVDLPLRRLVMRARSKEFPTLAALLGELQQALAIPASTRSLRQIPGYSSTKGKQRDLNEDFVGNYSLGMVQLEEAPQVGLYLVADGMGGHQSGELASKEVARVVLGQIQDKVQELQSAPKLKRATIKLDQVVTPGEVLRQAIQQANQVLLNTHRAVGSDRGTTITSALIVGNACAIANVGDSRTYLMRRGKLAQVTKDHSLVASLVAANMLKPHEVRSHPQRNQIYRTLGDKASVDVDIFEPRLEAGDRLLLCSDGLWEMVLDPVIEKIVVQASNPQAACDQLIYEANKNGGEDNISVIVIWVE